MGARQHCRTIIGLSVDRAAGHFSRPWLQNFGCWAEGVRHPRREQRNKCRQHELVHGQVSSRCVLIGADNASISQHCGDVVECLDTVSDGSGIEAGGGGDIRVIESGIAYGIRLGSQRYFDHLATRGPRIGRGSAGNQERPLKGKKVPIDIRRILAVSGPGIVPFDRHSPDERPEPPTL